MDAYKKFLIRKHTSLQKRLSRSRFTSPLDIAKGHWIIFGRRLQAAQFECLDVYTGTMNPILEAWKVGDYDVVLMSGALSQRHQKILATLKLDYASISHVPDLSQPGLIVMDMDSTAIQIECIDEIAKLAGVGDEVSAVTERAMQGELDFEQSLRLRVSKLKGADASIMESVRSGLPLMPELENIVVSLQALGWKVAIASGGFTYFSDHLKDKLGLDYARANVMEIHDGKLTGQVLGEVVSGYTKAETLVNLAGEYEIPLANTVAVGDGANDLIMMEDAGLGVAYHAKPKVQAQAQTSVRYHHLGGVLCILSAGLVKQKKISWQVR